MDASLALARKLLVLTADTEPASNPGSYSERSALEQLPQYLASVGPSAQATLDGLLGALRPLSPDLSSPVGLQRDDPPPHELARLLMRPELDPKGTQAWWVFTGFRGRSPIACTYRSNA